MNILKINWRTAMLAAVLVIVALRVAGELTGRGAPYWHMDLRTLQREQGAFYAGDYPRPGLTPARAGQPALKSAYPPPSFVLFVPWLPPGLGRVATREWFTAWQFAATGLLLLFAWRQGRELGHGLGWLLAGSVLAMTGLWADLLFGNVSAITTALLLGTLIAAERGHWARASACWVGAMVKPQMGWLFALPFLHRQGWRAWVAGMTAIGVCGLIACAWTGVTPAQIVRSSYGGDLEDWAAGEQLNNLVALLSTAGMPAGVALVACAVVGLGAGWWVLRGPLAQAGRLRQFAVIGIVNRVSTYHNYCDDLLLVFALVWLGRRAWTGGTADRLAFSGFAFSVWLPTTTMALTAVKAFVLFGWIAAGIWIVVADRQPAPEAASAELSA